MTRPAVRAALCLGAVALLLVPAVAAGPAPKLYFLRDGDTPLVGTGILNTTLPDGLEPSNRPVLVGTAELPSQVFQGVGEAHPGRLLGPIFVGLWTGPSVVLDGNITTVLYSVAPDGTLAVLASDSISLDLNTSQTPDPLSFVPPDPTDPEAAAGYIASRVLATLLQPPQLLQLGFTDIEVPLDHEIAVGFYLEAAAGSSLPVPVGAAATIQYDGQLMPTFLYVPWYAPDPEPTTTTRAPTRSSTSTSGGPSTLGPDTPGGESEDSPALGLLAVAALAAIAFAVRRRLE